MDSRAQWANLQHWIQPTEEFCNLKYIFCTIEAKIERCCRDVMILLVSHCLSVSMISLWMWSAVSRFTPPLCSLSLTSIVKTEFSVTSRAESQTRFGLMCSGPWLPSLNQRCPCPEMTDSKIVIISRGLRWFKCNQNQIYVANAWAPLVGLVPRHANCFKIRETW